MFYTKYQIATALGISNARINQILRRMMFIFHNDTFSTAEVRMVLQWVARHEHQSVRQEVPQAVDLLFPS